MPHAFRPATPADVPAIHALVESCFRGESSMQGWTHEAHLLGGQRTDAATIAGMLADPAQTIIVTEREGQIIGCVAVAKIDAADGPRGYIGMLSVSPTLQAAGLGRALLEEGERHARALGAVAVEMTVVKQRPELIAWYVRRGYVDTGREEPFPLDDPTFGLPKTRELVFVVLEKVF